MKPCTNTQRLKCIALDFDGVIVDSMPTQERIWREVARAILRDDQAEDQLIHNLYDGKSRDLMFDGILLSEEQRRLLRKEKNTRWFSERKFIALMDQVNRFLPRIKSRYYTAIATTADLEYVTHILQREHLSFYVDLILTGDDVSRGKPDPEMIFEIGKRLNIDNEQICVVGDTITDLEMSKRAACKFVLLAPKPIVGEQQCSLPWVNGWKELAELLQLN
jgi:HAD superfamily hydrolase (TIGR01549 family)